MKRYQADAGRMWQLATKATYRSTRYEWLAVREALQNSIDACIKAIAKGEIVKGRIDITYRESDSFDGEYTLIIEDNGIGMVADGVVIDGCADIDDIYLNLGGTDKTDGTTIGGFGIGKAVILGCAKQWTIRTRETLAQSILLGQTDKWEKMAYRQGTMIELDGIESEWHHSYKIEKTIQYSQWDTEQIDIYFNGDKQTPELPIEDNYKQWYFNDGITMATFTAIPEEKNLGAYMFYRFNGLYQFEDYFFNHNFSALIDIETDAIPGDDSYPFDTSREAIRGAVREFVEQVKHDTENNMNAGSTVDTYKTTIYKGNHALSDDSIWVLDNAGLKARLFNVQDRLEDIGILPMAVEDNQSKASMKDSPLAITFMVNIHKDYQGEINLDDKTFKQLLLWETVCNALAHQVSRESTVPAFHVGFIYEDNALAQYVMEKGKHYILWNPNNHLGRDYKLALVRMLEHASHEFSHMLGNHMHNESFIQTYSAIMDVALKIVNPLLKAGIMKVFR